MEELTRSAIGEYGVVVAALGGVVVYLFKALEKSFKDRIDAIETGLETSLKRHEDCERRNVECEQRSAALSSRIAVLERSVAAK